MTFCGVQFPGHVSCVPLQYASLTYSPEEWLGTIFITLLHFTFSDSPGGPQKSVCDSVTNTPQNTLILLTLETPKNCPGFCSTKKRPTNKKNVRGAPVPDCLNSWILCLPAVCSIFRHFVPANPVNPRDPKNMVGPLCKTRNFKKMQSTPLVWALITWTKLRFLIENNDCPYFFKLLSRCRVPRKWQSGMICDCCYHELLIHVL